MSAPARKIAVLALHLLAASLLLGCGGATRSGGSDATRTSAATGGAEHPIDMFPAIEQQSAGDQTAIARVGSVVITKAAFVHWDEALTPKIASYEPKSRADCSYVHAPLEVKLPRHRPKPSATELKALCIRQHQQLVKENVLQQLISYQWVLGEAAELGLSPSEADVQRALSKSVSQLFKHTAAFLRYLSITGRNISDARLQVRLDLATQRIEKLIGRDAQGEPQPDHAAIVRYYRANRTGSLQRKPLKQVEGSVREKLAEELLNRAKASFIREFRKKWLARTTCAPSYVISRCREWRGPSVIVTDDPYGVG